MALSLAALSALHAVAESGSYSAAARRIGLTAPGVSQHVRSLERSYDVTLFSREAGQLVATPFCQKICEHADQLLQHSKALERMLRNHGSLKNGVLSVGLGNAMPGMSLVAAFNKTFPDVELRVTTGSFQKIMRAVLDRSVDVGILPNIPKDSRFRRKVLLTNSVIAIAPPGSPLARCGHLTAQDLMSQRLIFRAAGSSTQKVVDRFFRDQGLSPSSYLTLDTRDGVYEAVANGMGIGFVWKTSTGRGSDVAQIALSGAPTTSEEVVFAPADQDLPTLKAFFSLIDSVAFD